MAVVPSRGPGTSGHGDVGASSARQPPPEGGAGSSDQLGSLFRVGDHDVPWSPGNGSGRPTRVMTGPVERRGHKGNPSPIVAFPFQQASSVGPGASCHGDNGWLSATAGRCCTSPKPAPAKTPFCLNLASSQSPSSSSSCRRIARRKFMMSAILGLPVRRLLSAARLHYRKLLNL
jgi:hypothetical protein